MAQVLPIFLLRSSNTKKIQRKRFANLGKQIEKSLRKDKSLKSLHMSLYKRSKTFILYAELHTFHTRAYIYPFSKMPKTKEEKNHSNS